jgi:hypothetical protein
VCSKQHSRNNVFMKSLGSCADTLGGRVELKCFEPCSPFARCSLLPLCEVVVNCSWQKEVTSSVRVSCV